MEDKKEVNYSEEKVRLTITKDELVILGNLVQMNLFKAHRKVMSNINNQTNPKELVGLVRKATKLDILFDKLAKKAE